MKICPVGKLSYGHGRHEEADSRLSQYCNRTQERTRQTMHVQLNTEAPSRNHCCSGKTINITNSECVFVALGIQHAMRIRHVIICGLPGSTIFSYIIL